MAKPTEQMMYFKDRCLGGCQAELGVHRLTDNTILVQHGRGEFAPLTRIPPSVSDEPALWAPLLAEWMETLHGLRPGSAELVTAEGEVVDGTDSWSLS